jgi:rhodanese-related sulfurtransferase
VKRLASGYLWGGLALLAAAGALALYGDPDLDTRWGFLEPEYGPRLENREVQIDPGELLALIQDDFIKLLIIDVRPERDWNLFHLKYSERIPVEELPRHRKRFDALPSNAVIVLVSNGEALATEAWKHVTVLSRPNAYILEGGLNNWLDAYGPSPTGGGEMMFGALGVAVPAEEPAPSSQPEELRHEFRLALGDRHPASFPDPQHVPGRFYVEKVKLVKKVVRKGGCG